jgi:hypothetical protein
VAGCAEVLEKIPCPGRCGGPRDRTQTRCSTAARCKLAVVPRMRVCNHDAVSTRDIRSQAFGSALAGSAIALAITNNFESNRAINRSQPETYAGSSFAGSTTPTTSSVLSSLPASLSCRSPRGPCPTWGGSSAFLSPRKVRRGPSARSGFFYEGGRVLAHWLGTIIRRSGLFKRF